MIKRNDRISRLSLTECFYSNRFVITNPIQVTSLLNLDTLFHTLANSLLKETFCLFALCVFIIESKLQTSRDSNGVNIFRIQDRRRSVIIISSLRYPSIQINFTSAFLTFVPIVPPAMFFK